MYVSVAKSVSSGEKKILFFEYATKYEHNDTEICMHVSIIQDHSGKCLTEYFVGNHVEVQHQYRRYSFSISHSSVRHFPEWSWAVVAFHCFTVVKSFTSWYALLLLFFLIFSFTFFMHLLVLLFTSLYFSNPSDSSHFSVLSFCRTDQQIR